MAKSLEISQNVGKIIREYKFMLGLTGRDIEEVTGVSKPMQWRIMKGLNNTTYDKICDILTHLRHPIMLNNNILETGDVIEEIRSMMKSKGIKPADIYKSTSVSKRTFGRMVNFENSPKFCDVSEIFEFMGNSLHCNGKKI